MELEERLDAVTTAAELVDLIVALADDLAENAERWENPDLSRYLEALAAWLRDRSTAPATADQTPLDPPSWRSVGAALLAARVYE